MNAISGREKLICPLNISETHVGRLGEGYPVSFDEFSRMMVDLQRKGCHNINFVNPSHSVPQILKALSEAIEIGLCVPLVYNTVE